MFAVPFTARDRGESLERAGECAIPVMMGDSAEPPRALSSAWNTRPSATPTRSPSAAFAGRRPSRPTRAPLMIPVSNGSSEPKTSPSSHPNNAIRRVLLRMRSQSGWTSPGPLRMPLIASAGASRTAPITVPRPTPTHRSRGRPRRRTRRRAPSPRSARRARGWSGSVCVGRYPPRLGSIAAW